MNEYTYIDIIKLVMLFRLIEEHFIFKSLARRIQHWQSNASVGGGSEILELFEECDF